MIIALTLGIVSSWHCLGMCGPLFSAFLLSKNNSSLNFFFYQTARILTYGLLGFIPVVLGINAIPFEYQQIISIVCGVLILISVWLPFFKHNKISGALTQLVKKINAFGMRQPNSIKYTLFGVANGLLPCGMVYIALTGSVATSQQIHPALFMLSFGLGTLPVFLVLFLAKQSSIGTIFIQKLSVLKPYILTGIAVLLILRGMNLNIPLISPAIEKTETTKTISCCHAPK